MRVQSWELRVERWEYRVQRTEYRVQSTENRAQRWEMREQSTENRVQLQPARHYSLLLTTYYFLSFTLLGLSLRILRSIDCTQCIPFLFRWRLPSMWVCTNFLPTKTLMASNKKATAQIARMIRNNWNILCIFATQIVRKGKTNNSHNHNF